MFKKYKIRLECKLEDAWIGAFFKYSQYAELYENKIKNKLDIWVCIFPCYPIHIEKFDVKKIHNKTIEKILLTFSFLFFIISSLMVLYTLMNRNNMLFFYIIVSYTAMVSGSFFGKFLEMKEKNK